MPLGCGSHRADAASVTPTQNVAVDLLQIGSIQLPGGVEAAKLVLDPKMLLDVIAGQTTAALPTSEQANAPAQRNVREAVRHLRRAAVPSCQTLAMQASKSSSYVDSGYDIGNTRVLGVLLANADASAASTIAFSGGTGNGSDGKDRAVAVLAAGTSIYIPFPGTGIDLTVAGLSSGGSAADPATGGTNPGSRIWLLNTGATTAYVTLYLSGAGA